MDSHARIVSLPGISGIRPHQFGSGAGRNLSSHRGSQAFGVTEGGARMLSQTPRRLRHGRTRRRAYLHWQSQVFAVAAVKLFSPSRPRSEGRTDFGANDGADLGARAQRVRRAASRAGVDPALATVLQRPRSPRPVAPTLCLLGPPAGALCLPFPKAGEGIARLLWSHSRRPTGAKRRSLAQ